MSCNGLVRPSTFAKEILSGNETQKKKFKFSLVTLTFDVGLNSRPHICAVLLYTSHISEYSVDDIDSEILQEKHISYCRLYCGLDL